MAVAEELVAGFRLVIANWVLGVEAEVRDLLGHHMG